MTSLRQLRGVAAAMMIAACLGPWHAAGHSTLQVRWTSALALNSLEQIDQRLAASWEYPLDVSRFAGKLEKAVITNCLSYFDLTKQGFQSTPLTYQLALGADCHALRALRQAVPAQRTHLAGFQLDAQTINDLPPDLSLIISQDDVRKVAAARKAGHSWRELQPITRVTPESSHTVLVEGHGWGERLEIDAFGDFNHDGLEDILVKTHAWLTGGTYTTTRLFVLTRFQDGGRLHVVTEYNLAK